MSARPWYLRAFIAVSAWFSALFILVWVVLLAHESEGALSFIGVTLLLGSALLARGLQEQEFLEQLLLAASMAGRCLFAYGAHQVVRDDQLAWLLVAAFEPLWYFLHPGAASRLVAALAGFGFLSVSLVDDRLWPFAFSVLGALTLAPSLLWARSRSADPEFWRPLGWAAALALAWGGIVVEPQYRWNGGAGLTLTQLNLGLSAVLALQLLVLPMRHRFSPALRAGFALLPLGLALMLHQHPGVLAALLLGWVAMEDGSRALRGLAALALLGHLGRYYYSLHETLLAKSGRLALAALVLGAVAWALAPAGDRRRVQGRLQLRGGRPALRVLMLLLAIAAGVGGQAWYAERQRNQGQSVLLELRPRDPRDILLGDHMVLQFSLCEQIAQSLPREQLRGEGSARAWAVVGPDGVLRLLSLAPAAPGPEALPLRYHWQFGRVHIGTTKAYFQEGEEPKYRSARFGRFRLQEDGALTWVGFES